MTVYSYPTPPYEMHHAFAVKAGVSLNLGPTVAVNTIAGTHNLSVLEALNVLAGNPKKQYKELAGVLNQLAGTKGLEAQGAASRWAGR